MKIPDSFLKILSLILALWCISGPILSCSGPSEDTGTEKPVEEKPVVEATVNIDLVKDGISDYTIVYHMDYRDAAIAMQEKILALTGAKLNIVYNPAVRTDKEIVIGPNHSSDYYNDPVWNVLYKNDYLIAAYNERIVIQGGSITGLQRALLSFYQMLDESISDKSLTVTLKNGLNRPEAKPFTIVSNGESKYKIIRSSNSGPMTVLAAKAFFNEIKNRTGVNLSLVTDTTSPSDYEIIIGETNREVDVDVSALGYMEYIIKVQGTRLIIVGGSDQATEVAVRHFVAEFGKSDKITTGQYTTDIYDLKYQGNYSPSILIVMSANVLNNDNHGNANNTIVKRIPRMLAVTTSYMPDIIGVQEFASAWIKTFVPQLSQYGYKHVYEQDSKVSIIYNSERIKIHEVKSWYYSDTPAIRSLTWGEANQRLMTYAICELIETGDKFVFISTHYAVGGGEELETSRKKATQIMLDKIKELGLPTIAVGDFNCTPSSEPYKMLSSVLSDARNTALISRGPQFTYNGMDGRQSGSIIDFVFASKNEFNHWSHFTVNAKINGEYYSDHNALVAELELKK